VPTVELWLWLETYLRTQQVEKIVIGYPRHADGAPVYFDGEIKQLKKKLESTFPEKQIILHDESFTSAKAKQVILQSGIKKEKRKDKSLIDKISAVIILQDFLQHY